MNLLCPVCKERMMIPRLFTQCGHSICEPCMVKSDCVEREKLESTFIVPSFSCPVCRQKTIIPWYNRPINRLALENLRENEEYEKAYEKYVKDKQFVNPEIPSNINLSTLTIRNRKLKTQKLYNEILPLLFDAASQGKPFITIIKKEMVHDIQMTADLLAKKLFDNNKIYRLVSTGRECDIEIIPSSRSYKTEYVNPLLTMITPRLLPSLSRRTRTLT
jgi:hypothetical protein